MIAALLVLAGFALVVLPGLIGPPLRLPAAEWARVAGASLLLGFAAIEIGLVLLALPTVLRALHAAGFASICERVLTPLAPGGDLLGWISGLVAMVIGVRAWRAGRRAYRNACAVEAEPWLGRHEDRGDFELVVLPTSRLVAVSVPAAQPQVLISDGLVERLDTDQLEAVIRHEATHHRFGHWRFSLLATSIERGLRPLPLVAKSSQSLRTALEVWADETAAGDSASGRALVRDAIVAVAGPVEDPQPHCASRRILRDRTRRLERGPAVRTVAFRLVIHAPALVLAMVSLALLTGWAVGAHHAAALTGYCPD